MNRVIQVLINLLFAGILSAVLPGCRQDVRIFHADENEVVYIGKLNEDDGVFRFRLAIPNNTPDTLYPLEYRTSCRCISADIKCGAVPPGREHIIDVAYDPAWQNGKNVKYMRVVYSSGAFSELAVTADVIPGWHPIEEEHPYDYGCGLHMSRKLLHFGLMKPGETSEIYFHIANGGQKRATIELIPDKEEYGRYIRMRQPGRMKPDERDTVHVKFTMPENALDTLCMTLQPYVNGTKTEEVLTVMAVLKL